MIALTRCLIVGCLLIAGCTSSAGATLKATEVPLRSTDVNEKAPCEAQGGKWEQLGFDPYRCNLPAPDAGQICQDSVECAGLCLLDTSDPEQMERALNPNDETVDNYGLCSDRVIVRGCLFHVEKGEIWAGCFD
jgi:hypothetical protein